MIKISRRFFFFLAFGCLGITTEIFFTAGHGIVASIIDGSPLDLKLEGNSYVWMLPIYGLAGVLLPIFMPWLRSLFFLLRYFVIALGIFAVEFLTGWLLDVTTGHCPWHYESPLSIMGYIHLGYTPFWMLFAFILDVVLHFLESIESKYIR